MSYLDRLMHESGLSPARHAPAATPTPNVDSVVFELSETVDTPHREHESDGPEPHRPTQTTGTERPVDPPVPWAPQPVFHAPATRVDHVPTVIGAVPDQPAIEPPMVPEPAPRPAVEEIEMEIETRVEQTAADQAPRLPREGHIALHAFHTIEDVRHWVASGPQSPGVTDSSSEATPDGAPDAAVEPLPAWEPPRARSRPPIGPRPEPLPDVHDVTLSIGRIDVTVEAPAAPPPPAAVQPQTPSSDTASGDTAAQRLRRHYVNWPGGG